MKDKKISATMDSRSGNPFPENTKPVEQEEKLGTAGAPSGISKESWYSASEPPDDFFEFKLDSAPPPNPDEDIDPYDNLSIKELRKLTRIYKRENRKLKRKRRRQDLEIAYLRAEKAFLSAKLAIRRKLILGKRHSPISSPHTVNPHR